MQVENKEGAEGARAHTLNATSVVLRLPALERKAQIAGNGAGVGALPCVHIHDAYTLDAYTLDAYTTRDAYTHHAYTHDAYTHDAHTHDAFT